MHPCSGLEMLNKLTISKGHVRLLSPGQASCRGPGGMGVWLEGCQVPRGQAGGYGVGVSGDGEQLFPVPSVARQGA